MVVRAVSGTAGTGQASLCYVSDSWAWFTTAPLDQQTGDDWDDAPYEHNAGQPYEWRDYMTDRIAPYELSRLAFEGNFETPDVWHANSPWSVDDINAGKVAWLVPGRYGEGGAIIFAGVPKEDFIRLVQMGGGTVYAPLAVAVPA